MHAAASLETTGFLSFNYWFQRYMCCSMVPFLYPYCEIVSVACGTLHSVAASRETMWSNHLSLFLLVCNCDGSSLTLYYVVSSDMKMNSAVIIEGFRLIYDVCDDCYRGRPCKKKDSRGAVGIGRFDRQFSCRVWKPPDPDAKLPGKQGRFANPETTHISPADQLSNYFAKLQQWS